MTNISKRNQSAMKKILCLFFSFLSFLLLLPQQQGVAVEAVSDGALYTTILTAKKGEAVGMPRNKVFYSPNNAYACIFQSDGNLVVYRHRSWKSGNQWTKDNAVWASQTGGYLNADCILQKDGNLAIYDTNKQAHFSACYSDLDRKYKVRLVLTNNGQLMLQRKEGVIFTDWSSYWWSTLSRFGKVYKTEPEASFMVGKWDTNSGLQFSDTYFIIDFADANGKMNVEFHNVDDAGSWPNYCNPYIIASTWRDSNQPFYYKECTIRLDVADGLYGLDYFMHINEDGTKIKWIGNQSVFNRSK